MIIYGITPDFFGQAFYSRTERILMAGIEILQYRDKTSSDEKYVEVAKKLKAMCADHGTIFYINDRVHLYQDIESDGVHVGKDDTDISVIRKKYSGLRIGGSSYCDPELAVLLQSKGADYVAFGSMYPTSTKKDYTLCNPEVIKVARPKLKVPIYAIGGIDFQNVGKIIDLKYDGIAVSSMLYSSQDPYESTLRLRSMI
ncbi:thiamine phosphate synthase [Cuniculiplasma sp. SKW3]|uniref:thiamine phosphate synthase n=1 Tax=Cuniculiplasma sp. SKW3 TaxID=3400170 RepID=UPI003FD016F5